MAEVGGETSASVITNLSSLASRKQTHGGSGGEPARKMRGGTGRETPAHTRPAPPPPRGLRKHTQDHALPLHEDTRPRPRPRTRTPGGPHKPPTHAVLKEIAKLAKLLREARIDIGARGVVALLDGGADGQRRVPEHGFHLLALRRVHDALRLLRERHELCVPLRRRRGARPQALALAVGEALHRHLRVQHELVQLAPRHREALLVPPQPLDLRVRAPELVPQRRHLRLRLGLGAGR
mmetsp:Transcript_14037/g.41871  ORF Transcript_14037/g.41871 Transcript_14037/m.41871 type:complete len:237 (-) Transcript_14037:710-1420(-)